jgi:hypothetical protein
MIKCICGQLIQGVHYEGVSPSAFNSGSKSFVAVATPCGHAIGAVPMTWENKLDKSLDMSQKVKEDIGNLRHTIELLDVITKRIAQKVGTSY